MGRVDVLWGALCALCEACGSPAAVAADSEEDSIAAAV